MSVTARAQTWDPPPELLSVSLGTKFRLLPHLTALQAGYLAISPYDREAVNVQRVWFSRLWPGLELRFPKGRLMVQWEDFRTFSNLEPR